MALKEVLRLVIEADTRGAVQQIDNIGKAADKSLAKGKSGLDKFGLGLQKAGVGMVGFGAVAVFGLSKMAKASEDAHLSTVKLQNSLSANPRLAGENVKTYTDLATAIQGKTAADADDITAGIAVLAQGKLQGQQIRELTPLVVDLARKKGIGEVQAFTLASKAVAGNAGALKRAGIQVDETKFKTDAYGATVDALKTSVGGFSEAEGKTFAGSLQRMKNQLGDLAEGVGGGAVDAFTDMFGAVGKAAGALEKISPGAQNAIGKIGTFGAVALIAVGGVSTLIGKLIEARDNFGKVRTAISEASGKLGGFGNVLKGGAIIAGIFALDKALDEAFGTGTEVKTANLGRLEKSLLQFGKTGRLSADLMKIVGTDFKKLGEALSTADLSGLEKARDSLDRFERGIPVAGRVLSDGFAKDVDQARQTLDDFDKALARIAQTDPAAAFDIVKAAAKEMGVSVKDLMPALDDYDTVIGDVSAEAEKGGVKVDEFGRSMDDQAGSTEAATQALQDYEDKLHALVDPLFGLQDALEGNRDAQGEVNAKQLEAIAAQDAYTGAVKKFGPKSKEASAAFLEMTSAQDALTDANTHAVRSAEDVDFAVEELRTEIEKNPAALDQAKAKLKQWQAQGLITAGQAAATARKFDALAASVKKVPSSKVISVSAHGTEGAKIKIIQVRDALGQLHDKTLTIGVTTALGAQAAGIMSSKMFGGQFASGGKVPGPKGSSQIIEAHGGEIVVPAHDAAAMRKFRPEHFGMSAPAMAGGGGGTVINVAVDMSGAIISSKSDAQRWVADAWNRAAEQRQVNVRGKPL